MRDNLLCPNPKLSNCHLNQVFIDLGLGVARFIAIVIADWAGPNIVPVCDPNVRLAVCCCPSPLISIGGYFGADDDADYQRLMMMTWQSKCQSNCRYTLNPLRCVGIFCSINSIHFTTMSARGVICSLHSFTVIRSPHSERSTRFCFRATVLSDSHQCRTVMPLT